MKNEDRIVELLSESLKRQDQMVERLGNLEKSQKSVVGEIKLLQYTQKVDNDRLVGAINALTDIVKVWMDNTKDIQEIRDRVSRLEKHAGL